MDNMLFNVKDICAADRRAIEHLLGGPLADDQQVAIHLSAGGENRPSPSTSQQANEVASLPEWCHVYAGLSNDEIAALEHSILSRANLTRNVE